MHIQGKLLAEKSLSYFHCDLCTSTSLTLKITKKFICHPIKFVAVFVAKLCMSVHACMQNVRFCLFSTSF